MVEDSEIKTTVSPFAMREGEMKVFDGKDGYVSMNQILQKINVGHINEVHFKILELINKFEFLTSRQIFQLLQLDNIEIKDQDKLNKKLEQLLNNKIITRYYFTSTAGNGVFRIYCMEKMGKYLLNSREIDCKWQPSDNAKPVEMIKKKLAGNQLVIAYMRKVKNFRSCQLKPAIVAKRLSKTFKPVARIDLAYRTSEVSIVYEVVRRNEGWEEKLIDRMRLWQDFYSNFVPGDSGFRMMPQLVFLCEDKKHMAEVFKVIYTHGFKFDKINFYYSTDLEQNDASLENSLYEFVIEDGKFKIKIIDAKILKPKEEEGN